MPAVIPPGNPSSVTQEIHPDRFWTHVTKLSGIFEGGHAKDLASKAPKRSATGAAPVRATARGGASFTATAGRLKLDG
jgi:hypothetical protein